MGVGLQEALEVGVESRGALGGSRWVPRAHLRQVGSLGRGSCEPRPAVAGPSPRQAHPPFRNLLRTPSRMAVVLLCPDPYLGAVGTGGRRDRCPWRPFCGSTSSGLVPALTAYTPFRNLAVEKLRTLNGSEKNTKIPDRTVQTGWGGSGLCPQGLGTAEPGSSREVWGREAAA